MLEKTKENRYRHYKGGIYYKIGEAAIGDIDFDDLYTIDKIGEALYEPTSEKMNIYNSQFRAVPYLVAFVDREVNVHTEYLEDVVIYQSEDTKTTWICLKNEFEGMNKQGIKRFTLANA